MTESSKVFDHSAFAVKFKGRVITNVKRGT